MVIDYVSSAMESQEFEKLFSSKDVMPGQQAQKFNRLMIQGLANNKVEVHAITGRPITSRNCKKKYLKAEKKINNKVTYFYGSDINIKGIKNIWQMLFAYRSVLKDSKKGQTAVVCDVLNASVSYGASVAAKQKGIPCIGIVTDLPDLMVTGTRKGHIRIVRKVLKNCSGYIPLTEAMNELINPSHKPYTVIEGLCDVDMHTKSKKNSSDVRKCMYAGLLDARYGVKNMVDGFLRARVPNTELHLYGSGPYVEELKVITQNHNNVIYHGVVLNEEVVAAELEACVLINPRSSDEEFTKYSFPSKIMEYMASGTPVLTTKLPGMPSEYFPYIFFILDETADGMSIAFKEVLAKSNDELFEKGRTAKEFVLSNKNNVQQSARLIRLIEEHYKT